MLESNGMYISYILWFLAAVCMEGWLAVSNRPSPSSRCTLNASQGFCWLRLWLSKYTAKWLYGKTFDLPLTMKDFKIYLSELIPISWANTQLQMLIIVPAIINTSLRLYMNPRSFDISMLSDSLFTV